MVMHPGGKTMCRQFPKRTLHPDTKHESVQTMLSSDCKHQQLLVEIIRKLVTLEQIDTEYLEKIDAYTSGMVETSALYDGCPPAAQRLPHLRLVVNRNT
jgi:hypothetical protein